MKHKEPIMGSFHTPYRETYARDFGLYLWWAFCMEWSKLISEKGMEIAELYEKTHSRIPIRVHQKGVGYDLHSKNENEERFIEVKGISESWKTYTWQPLHHTEIKALRKNPSMFFLYIIHFDISKENRNSTNLNNAVYKLFVISGNNLQKSFRLIPESYALKPISRRRLSIYEVKE